MNWDNLTKAQVEILFQIWYGNFELNDATAADYHYLKDNGWIEYVENERRIEEEWEKFEEQ